MQGQTRTGRQTKEKGQTRARGQTRVGEQTRAGGQTRKEGQTKSREQTGIEMVSINQICPNCKINESDPGRSWCQTCRLSKKN